jgi:branched-chain amino acid aminotransferase
MIVWLNGRCLGAEAARIDPSDRGLLLGDGLFETMRAVDGRVPLLDRHLRRLREAAAILGVPLDPDDRGIAAACAAVLEANGLTAAALRLTLTRGPGPRGLLPPVDPRPTLLLAAFPLPLPPPPARAVVSRATRRNERSPLSRLKTLSYLDNLIALEEACSAGADDALLLNTAGDLACATTANLFLVEGAALLTPRVEDGALPGITRGRVLELANGLALACREERLPPERLAKAGGALLTSSLIGIRPLVAVDGRRIGAGIPHPLAERLQGAWVRW